MEMMTNNTTTRGAYFSLRRNYIEGLQVALAPVRDFDQIRYARSYSTEEEFVKISDTIGGSCFLNVTGLSNAEVFREVCKAVLIDDLKADRSPSSLILDTNKKRQIAPLFRGGEA